MNTNVLKGIVIRGLSNNEDLPIELLLLADEAIEAIDKYISNSEVYVVEKENRVIAVYVLQVISKTEIEIKNIAVEDKYQGHGIGKLLLADACTKAKRKGFKIILIGTGDASTRQLLLYQKEGFHIYDKKQDFFIDNYPAPIYENGNQLKDMIMLKKELA